MADRLPTIIDGGAGTELQRLGAPMDGKAWSARAVLSHPDTLFRVHASFLEAGAQLIIANTFSAGRHVLKEAGLERSYEAINRDAVTIARRAATAHGGGALVAGAVSTTTFSGPLDYTKLHRGSAAVEEYARQAAIQAEAGVHLVVLEMMRDIEQTAHALEGALRCGLPVWVGFSCEVTAGETAAAEAGPFLVDSGILLDEALDALDLEKAQAVGIMHTLVEDTPAALDVLQERWKGHTFAYPHAGRFEMPHWVFQDVMAPEAFADMGMSLLERGVDAVGGCCGMGPAHIRALRDRLG